MVLVIASSILHLLCRNTAEDNISCLTDLTEYTGVDVCIKVLELASSQAMQGQKTTQNVVIADKTATLS